VAEQFCGGAEPHIRRRNDNGKTAPFRGKTAKSHRFLAALAGVRQLQSISSPQMSSGLCMEELDSEVRIMNERFLREAIRLSMEKMELGEGGPFGAVIVKNGRVVGEGWNRVTSTNDPTAHAEIVAIRDVCSRLASFSLSGCEIYASCEPFPMCLGAIHWARLDALYFAATREDAAAGGFDDLAIYEQMVLPTTMRSIPVGQALREEARGAFEAWRNKGDRIEY
jgi:tRNA(Arg) A34 adenosine deaminase TadA